MKQSDLILRPLRIEDEVAFRAAVEEFQQVEPDWAFAFHFDPVARFSDYVQTLTQWANGEALPERFVPNTYLVGVVGKVVVGRVSLRHTLNDFLARIGGHAGYGVVPSQRRRGYATEMLRLTLPVAASLGLKRLLLTCDDGNIGSQRVIEKNGGVFEGFAEAPELKVPKRRYWIDLAKD